jgi:hypothetical protein
MSETAWLIERADPKSPGCVLPNSFLGVAGSYDGVYGSGELRWLDNARDALRFARQQDAAMFIGAIASLQENLPHRKTIPGLCSGSPRAIPTEHSWGMGP